MNPLRNVDQNVQPIGMLDSGVGGLSVLRDVRRLLPHESVLYVADQGHLPYGPRPREEIKGFVEGIARFLLEADCKMIVIPCNAASAAALHSLRDLLPDVPIIGMEPAIKPAAANTRSGVIGVITTKATFQGELFASVLDRYAQGIRVETQVCPELVTLAEQGALDTPAARRIIADYLEPLRTAGIDQLVLGCTHFPFLATQIAAYLGPGVTIVDPSPAVAQQVKRILEQRQLANSSAAQGQIQYVTTGDRSHFADLLAALIDETNANIQHGNWRDNHLTIADRAVNSA